MTLFFVTILIIVLILIAESSAYWVYLKKVPIYRKRNLEFLLYGRVLPFDPDTRGASEGAAPRYSEHPFSGWSLNPKFMNIYGDRIHNAQGFREITDFKELDHTDELRIYCAGDSTTYGTNIESNEQTWPFLLGEILNRDSGRKVRVINGGVGGFNTYQSFIRLSSYIDYLNPDIVMIAHPKNDFAPFYNNPAVTDEIRPDYSNSMRPLSFQGMLSSVNPFARWSYIARLFAVRNMSTRQMNISYCYGPNRPRDIAMSLATKTDFSIIRTMQKNIVSLCQGRGIPLVYMTSRVDDPVFSKYVDEENNLIRELQYVEQGVWVLDMERIIEDEFYEDKLHYSHRGCEVASERISKYLLETGLLSKVRLARSEQPDLK